jgi:predicted DsbA family dithiol-disulfide isomerase
MAGERGLSVDVVSDVVCPWCFVGLRRLERAIAMVPDIDIAVQWRPFQLDASIPPGGVDRQQYMLAKFGSGERIAQAHERLALIGEREDIDFDFEAIKIAPNTLDAHRLIRWAATSGRGTQHVLTRRLFKLYFEWGADIGDRKVLVDAAADAGMDAAVVATLLDGNADRDAVIGEIETAARMGVTGVPCFVIDGKYALVGAQEAEALAEAFTKVADAKENGEPGEA